MKQISYHDNYAAATKAKVTAPLIIENLITITKLLCGVGALSAYSSPSVG